MGRVEKDGLGLHIFVFDREVAAHPDCIPPEHLRRLGDFRATLPAYLACDQQIILPGLEQLALPDGFEDYPYHFFRRAP